MKPSGEFRPNTNFRHRQNLPLTHLDLTTDSPLPKTGVDVLPYLLVHHQLQLQLVQVRQSLLLNFP